MRRAVVLLSGGLDSATVLAISRAQGFEAFALSFRYGQRHEREIAAAEKVARSLGACEHRIAQIDLRVFGGSALTADLEVPTHRSEAEMARAIPVTYVPARNTIFLSYALAWAEVIEARDIFIGANAIDYSGYPDCRPEFIRAFEELANLGTKAGVEGDRFTIHAPLLAMSKAEIIQRGISLGVDYSLTHSCYNPTADGTGVRRLRFLPAPPERLSRSGSSPIQFPTRDESPFQARDVCSHATGAAHDCLYCAGARARPGDAALSAHALRARSVCLTIRPWRPLPRRRPCPIARVFPRPTRESSRSRQIAGGPRTSCPCWRVRS